MTAVDDSDWRSLSPAAETVELLIARLDEIRRLSEAGMFDDARRIAYHRRWLETINPAGIPADVLQNTQEWVDAAYDALRQPFVCAATVQRALMMARREISG